MRTRFLYSLVIVHFLIPCSKTAIVDDIDADLEVKFRTIDSLIQRTREELRIPGMAAGIVVDGRTTVNGYGFRNHEDPGSHVSNRTLFAIGSCTKAFTTYMLERLVNVDRVLAWSDLVVSRVPEFRLKDVLTWSRVQIKDLLTHVSGLPAHDLVWMYSNYSKEELLTRIAHLQANYDLREKYQYNNLMYVVAGVAMERATGQSWENMVRERIFKPLNMQRSYCSIGEVRTNQVQDIAAPHKSRTLVRTFQEPSISKISWMDTSVIGPAASIISSAEDMTRWIEMQLQLSGVSKEMHIPQVVVPTTNPTDGQNFGYGFGWGTSFYRGRYMLGHSGLTHGFSSRVTLFPDEKIGIVVLANLGSMLHELRNLTCQIADVLTDRVAAVNLEDMTRAFVHAKFRAENLTANVLNVDSIGKRPVDRPEEYVGSFENAGYGIVEVLMVNGSQLFVSYDFDRILFSLEPKEGPDFFEARSEFPREAYYECSFVRNSSGTVVGCRFDFEPSVSPIFFGRRSLHATPDASKDTESVVENSRGNKNEESRERARALSSNRSIFEL